MKKLMLIFLSATLCWSAAVAANSFSIHNDVDKTIHWRVRGPTEAKYYGSLRAGEAPTIRQSKHDHVTLYIYFRRGYDWLSPFSPIFRDLICLTPCISLHDSPEIHVVIKDKTYQCVIQ